MNLVLDSRRRGGDSTGSTADSALLATVSQGGEPRELQKGSAVIVLSASQNREQRAEAGDAMMLARRSEVGTGKARSSPSRHASGDPRFDAMETRLELERPPFAFPPANEYDDESIAAQGQARPGRDGERPLRNGNQRRDVDDEGVTDSDHFSFLTTISLLSLRASEAQGCRLVGSISLLSHDAATPSSVTRPKKSRAHRDPAYRPGTSSGATLLAPHA